MPDYPMARVILFVKNMERMRAFYEQTLGLTALAGVDDGPGFCSLDAVVDNT
jgi:catechol 2,3-dioxygenase-like lactoylglutathione lyase family enzyme